MNRKIKGLLSLTLAFSSSIATAVPIAIVDSGTDFKHEMLIKHTWTKPGKIVGDSFSGDIHGRNFADDNNDTIDYSFMGKFSPDTFKFFEVQLRELNGVATDEDRQWMLEKRKDEKFIQELSTFGNFVHGTHVAGIASRGAPLAEIMAAKIIPTEIKKPSEKLNDYLHFLAQKGITPLSLSLGTNPIDPKVNPVTGFFQDIIMKAALWFVAGQHSTELDPVGQYVSETGMRVANCSFGTGTSQAKAVAELLAKSLIQRDLTEEESQKYAVYFINELDDKGKGFATGASKTLFVIAAGNDGLDNDTNPAYPANLRLENTITVAATRDFDRLASFSNYGEKMVDIAAPGVGIRSSIPTPSEHDTLTVSGTSQASPYIANIAGRIMDENPNLSVPEVRKILMQTVDKKSFLAGKVVSGGIANQERAVIAARLSVHESLDEAIRDSHAETANAPSVHGQMVSHSMLTGPDTGYDGDPIPLPSVFQVVK